MYQVMQAIVDPIYYKRTQVISPGVVGTVGDVLGSVRLKQSTPDMAMRFDSDFYGTNEERLGSNVQDGFSYSFTSGGGPPTSLQGSFATRGYKTNHGWRYQDLRAPDKNTEPLMGSTGRYNWYNKIANVYEAKRTGDLFLPLPGPFQPTSMTRGSQYPVITDILAAEDNFTQNGDQRKLQNPVKDEVVSCPRGRVDQASQAIRNPPAPTVPSVVSNNNDVGFGYG